MCKFQIVADFDCDFTLLPGAADVHYNIQTKKETMNCQFYINFVGETFICFRDVCKFQSVVNFDCDFTMLPSATNIHYDFQTKKYIDSYQFYVSLIGETFF